MRTPLPLLALLAACASAPDEIEDEEFAYWGAYALCEREAECNRGAFEAQYFSMGDCRASLEILLEQTLDLYDRLDCDYSASAAGDAWNEVLEMSCEDYYEGDYDESVADIWGDCGGGGGWTGYYQ